MANLTFIERDFFEKLFEMGSGYVLDFSNRTFQEFVYEVMSIDIYAKYPGLSKANAYSGALGHPFRLHLAS